MKLLDFIAIKLTILLIIGILIGHYLALSKWIPLLILGSSLALLGVFILKRQASSITFGFLLVPLMLALGMISYTLSNSQFYDSHYSRHAKNEPLIWHLKIRDVLKSTSFSNRYIASVKAIDCVSTTGKILLTISAEGTQEEFTVDQEIIHIGIAREINSPLNPHQFNYRSYLQNLGIIHQLKIDPEGYLPVNSGSSTLQGNLAKFRKLIVLNLSKAGFEQEELSIIQALLLGHREDISEETFNNYKNAGAVHILAVSGLHIGILLLLIQFLLAPLRKMAHGKTIILILSVFILWAYAFLAGLSSSVIRAVTMFSFVAYAIYLNRPRNTFNILALSMFFLLLIFDAKLLFDVGFQMSYAAVFSIVWIYPKLQKFWNPQNRILQKFWQLSSVSLAAQLGVFPIALFYFHQFPALFFISNLIVVPCLGIILGGGILIILLGLINWLPESLSFFYSELIKTMNGFIAWVAKQESFVIQDIPFDGLQLLLVVVLIFTCIYAIMKFNYKRLVYAMTCLACLQLYSIYTIYGVQNKEQVLVMHQTKNTTLFHQSGNELQILTHDTIVVQNLIRNFNVAERIQRTQFANPGNSYVWGSNQLTIIDSMGIYPSTQKNALVLLSQSPKINLERMIDSIKPSQIIADGSNYLSDVNRWRITCLQKKLPFHHTGKEGAYLIKPY